VEIKHYPPGMGEESRRLHREYNALVEAQRNGAKNGPEVVRLTDECAAKGIILVPAGAWY
jgi:deoxycytidylate deaminase